MNRKRVFDLLKVAISILLIAFLLNQIGLGQTLEVLTRANLYYLVAALALFMLTVAMRAYRWQVLLTGLGVEVPLSELTALYFVGFLFSNVLPSGFGGDVVRMYELSRSSRRGAEAVNTVLVDRFLGLIVLQAIALVGLAFGYRLVSPGVIVLTVLLFGGSLVVVWLLLNRRVAEFVGRRLQAFTFLTASKQAGQLQRLYESLHAYPAQAIWKALGISFVFNVSLIAVNYLIALALGVDISIWYFLLFVPLTSIIMMIPISLNGLGIREVGYVTLFAQAGVADSVAFSMSLLIYALSVLAGLVGGAVYILRGAREYLVEEEQR
jgi:uncharacterized protein (TIRG00374 family)